ncbi:MAG: 16S rRNA (adenine(1518)-N(6)/adenine(1519)-N(6))-dimethyltransferase RsmA [Thermodesulfovibrionales bacterium]|nr:16S rRNA (adenine(1518)-N(6)/adenine(1519)-N(6))-dimethyltransferase RsmA [Thermodesulfovibrionales bacterium]
MKVKKFLGQHFLFDPSILKKIIETANLDKEDTVVEIGAGHGNLTTLLAEVSKRVIAIEFDKKLYDILLEKSSTYGNIEPVHCDAMKFPYESIGIFKVVANIPYYITTPLLFRLLKARKKIKTITLTLQKEVAERLVAHPGIKDYGLLSITAQYYSQPQIRFIIPAGAFRPIPRVDSAVVHITILEEPRINVSDEKLFFRIIKTCFSQRRKTILNNLRNLDSDMKGILLRLGIQPNVRAETLSIEDFGKICDALIQKKKGVL